MTKQAQYAIALYLALQGFTLLSAPASLFAEAVATVHQTEKKSSFAPCVGS